MGQKKPGESKQVAAETAHLELQSGGDQAKKPMQDGPKPFPWGALAKLLAGIGAVGGIILHLMGYVSYQAYLTAWGIDPGLFPKPTDATVINGYYAFMERTVTLFSAVRQGTGYFLGAIAAVTFYVFILLRINKSNSNSNYKIRRLAQRAPGWGRDLAKSLLLTFTMLAGVPIALFFAVFVLTVPAILGQNFGQSAAKNEMALFRMGCDVQPDGRRCVDLRKDGKTIARGFPIDSSESHMALFDVAEKRARALERDGTELLVDPTRYKADTK